MQKKKRILELKKFTIASLRGKYDLIGAGQTNDITCAETVDPNLCKTVEPRTSCLSSNTEPITNARAVCASNIGSGSD